MQFLRKMGIDLPQVPDTPVFGIYTQDALPYHRGTCSIMLTAALFIIVRIRPPRYSSTKIMDNEIVVYLYNGIFLSQRKRT